MKMIGVRFGLYKPDKSQATNGPTIIPAATKEMPSINKHESRGED